MINGLRIGFDLLVLGLMLMMMWRELPSASAKRVPWWNEFSQKGIVVVGIGVVAVVWGLLGERPEALRQILVLGGGNIMVLGVAWILKATVESGHGKVEQVKTGACLVSIVGALMTIILAVLMAAQHQVV